VTNTATQEKFFNNFDEAPILKDAENPNSVGLGDRLVVEDCDPVSRLLPSRGTKRTLLLTWAGLSPAGWIAPALRLAHLFDHLIGTHKDERRDIQSERLGGLIVDY
jgi:hypothetical protein